MDSSHGEEQQGPSREINEPVLLLTRAIAKGDPEAFTRFYERWFDRAFRMARSITRRDEAFCLDVVQDAMLRVVKSLRPLESENALANWMAKVIHATAIDHFRRESRRARREERAMADRVNADEGQDAHSEIEERVQWLELELSKLSAAEKNLLNARFDQNKTLEETGAAAGMTGNAAHGRIRRIVKRLQKAAREVFDESL